MNIKIPDSTLKVVVKKDIRKIPERVKNENSFLKVKYIANKYKRAMCESLKISEE